MSEVRGPKSRECESASSGRAVRFAAAVALALLLAAAMRLGGGSDAPPQSREFAVTLDSSEGPAATAWSRLARALRLQKESNTIEADLDRLRSDPIGAELDLVRAAQRDPSTADVLAGRLGRSSDRGETWRIARVLQRFPSRRRTADIAGRLPSLPPERRAIALHAILGRREPEAIRFLCEQFLAEPHPEVRAHAAFALQEVSDAAPPEVFEGALQNAQSPQTETALRIESMDLLGTRPLTPPEQQLLEAVFRSSSLWEVKNAALRALVSGDAERGRVSRLLAEVVADPTLPGAMRQSAEATLRAMPR